MDQDLLKKMEYSFKASLSTLQQLGWKFPPTMLGILMDSVAWAEQAMGPHRINFHAADCPGAFGGECSCDSTARVTPDNQRMGSVVSQHIGLLQRQIDREHHKRTGMQKRLDEVASLASRIARFQVQNDSAIDDLRSRVGNFHQQLLDRLSEVERAIEDQDARMQPAPPDEEVERRLRQAAPPEETRHLNDITEYTIRGVVTAAGGGTVVVVVDRDTPNYPEVLETVEMHFMNKQGPDGQTVLRWPDSDHLVDHLIKSHGFHPRVIPERSMNDLPGYHNRAHEDPTAEHLDHRHVGFRS